MRKSLLGIPGQRYGDLAKVTELRLIEELGGPAERPFFSTQAKKDIEQIIIMREFQADSLSYRFLDAFTLLQAIPLNFPNASIYDPTGLSRLVKRPGGCNVEVHPYPKVDDIRAIGSDPSKTVFFGFNTSLNDFDGLADVAKYRVSFLNFRAKSHAFIFLENGDYSREFKVKRPGKTDIDSMRNEQMRMLQSIGIESGEAMEGKYPFLSQSRFSDELLGRIDVMSKRITELAGDRPVIFVNMGKFVPTHFREGMQMTKVLKQMVVEEDVAVLVNRPPKDHHNTRRLNDEGARLLKTLDAVPGKKAVIIDDFPEMDIVDMAAAMHIADVSGGFHLNAYGGGSILGSFFETREVVVDSWNGAHHLRERPHVKRIKKGEVVDTLLPTLKEMILR